jgi:hypothetical protein
VIIVEDFNVVRIVKSQFVVAIHDGACEQMHLCEVNLIVRISTFEDNIDAVFCLCERVAESIELNVYVVGILTQSGTEVFTDVSHQDSPPSFIELAKTLSVLVECIADHANCTVVGLLSSYRALFVSSALLHDPKGLVDEDDTGVLLILEVGRVAFNVVIRPTH